MSKEIVPKNQRRVNMFMNVNLYDWYKDRAEQMGVSVSALMIMTMHQYREDKEIIESQLGHRLLSPDDFASTVKEAITRYKAINA
jgi:hypothetical protein